MLEEAPSHLTTRSWEALAAQYAEDAILQPALEPAVRGRANIPAWARALPELEEVRFSNVAVYGDGDVAYATSDYVTKPRGLPPHSGKQLLVFRRAREGSWVIAAASTSADAPLPGPSTVEVE